jgi:glycine betaine/proline transport system permease protein
MNASTTPSATPPASRAVLSWTTAIAAVLAAVALSRSGPLFAAGFPAEWNLGLRALVDDIQRWIIGNRNTHPLFVNGIDVLSNAIGAGVRALEDGMILSPWPAVLFAITSIAFVVRGARLALFAGCAVLMAGLFGLWVPMLNTLAQMLVAVLLTLLAGVPIGVLAALNLRFGRVLRPLLDLMQTMPALVYLVPVILIFGIGRVPAVIATMIYALPPVIRLTALGVQSVPAAVIESADAFGSTKRQRLWQVQLPLALPMVLAGVNQSIMMALAMVVIAAMIGSPGLGQEVSISLLRLRVGQAFEGGLIIVLIAILFDRISSAFGALDVSRISSRSLLRALLIIACAATAGFMLGLIAFPVNDFPAVWRFNIRVFVDGIVDWLKRNAYWLTSGVGDALTLYVLNPLRNMLTALPWPVLTALAGLVGLRAGGWRLAAGCVLIAITIGLLGMWTFALDTLSQVLITLLITALLALPIGVLASQYGRFSALLRPLTDMLQTLPTFVFLVPVMMLFNLGRVPGLIAAVLYAIPAGIKLTELGLRGVAPEAIEAARAFGSTRLQTISKVQLPLARAAISAALNQMTMLVLAMTVISGMVGGSGLGQEAVTGFARNQTGQGFESGLAIVLLAIVLDRVIGSRASDT